MSVGKVTSITVSAEERENSRTFISWTVASGEKGWTTEQAHAITAQVNKEVTKHVQVSQLAKRALSKDEFIEKVKNFNLRYTKLVADILIKETGGALETDTPT